MYSAVALESDVAPASEWFSDGTVVVLRKQLTETSGLWTAPAKHIGAVLV